MKKTSDIIGKICDVWMHELRTILKDQGVMLFMVIGLNLLHTIAIICPTNKNMYIIDNMSNTMFIQ